MNWLIALIQGLWSAWLGNKTSTAVEVAKLKLQIDRIELYVGLKREPIAVTLPGEARIS